METLSEHGITIVSLTEEDSSFVTMITYEEDSCVMGVQLRNIGERVFKDVPKKVFIDFMITNSKGSFYTNNIKQKFKLMAKSSPKKQEQEPVKQEKNKPNKINRSSKTEFRWIQMSICVDEIDKSWLAVGKDSGKRYLNMSMRMQPEGVVDEYGNLGMIVQKVPADVYKKDKTVKGAILGNASQLEWNGGGEQEETRNMEDEDGDDLPF